MALNKMGPPCPNCGALISRVVMTARDDISGFYRRRHCQFCDHRFVTAQPAEIITSPTAFKWNQRSLAKINWQHPELISSITRLTTPRAEESSASMPSNQRSGMRGFVPTASATSSNTAGDTDSKTASKT